MITKRLHGESGTAAFAARFAKRLQPGDVLALAGELGTGKSVFARGVMRGLGVRDEALPSPTFALIQEYRAAGCKVAHMDWYRIHSIEELELLGVRDYFAPPWICLIEWPQRGASLLPRNSIRVELEFVPDAPEARLLRIIHPIEDR